MTYINCLLLIETPSTIIGCLFINYKQRPFIGSIVVLLKLRWFGKVIFKRALKGLIMALRIEDI